MTDNTPADPHSQQGNWQQYERQTAQPDCVTTTFQVFQSSTAKMNLPGRGKAVACTAGWFIGWFVGGVVSLVPQAASTVANSRRRKK